MNSKESVRKRWAHSVVGSTSALATYLLSNAWACVLHSIKPNPPWSLGCISFFHATSKVFRCLVSLSNLHRKSLKSRLIYSRTVARATTYIMWCVVMLCRTCCMRMTFSIKVSSLLAHLEIHLVILSRQKLYMLVAWICCPNGAPKYFWISPRQLIVQPMLYNHWGIDVIASGTITDFARLSFAPKASS